MKIKFIIYSHFFKERGMSVKGDWNFPHLPRIGEEISPHIIMFQNEFTYQNLLEYLTGSRSLHMPCSQKVFDIVKESKFKALDGRHHYFF